MRTLSFCITNGEQCNADDLLNVRICEGEQWTSIFVELDTTTPEYSGQYSFASTLDTKAYTPSNYYEALRDEVDKAVRWIVLWGIGHFKKNGLRMDHTDERFRWIYDNLSVDLFLDPQWTYTTKADRVIEAGVAVK